MDVDCKELQRRLGSLTKQAKNSLINYDAYLLADAEYKNINLQKYKAQIKANLSDDSDDDHNETDATK